MSTLEKGLVVADKNQIYTYPLTWKFHSWRELKHMFAKRLVWIRMFTVVLFTIAWEWKHPTCASIGEWNRQIVMCSYNELVMYPTTLDKSQKARHKRTCCVIPFIEVLEEEKLSLEKQQQKSDCLWGLGRHGGPFQGDKMFWIVWGMWITGVHPFVRLYSWDSCMSVYVCFLPQKPART